MRLAAGRLDDLESDVAGAARNIQHFPACALGRGEPGDEGVFPQTVHPGGHEVVHHVIALGDFVENVVDPALLLAGLNRREAERAFHAATFCHTLNAHRPVRI